MNEQEYILTNEKEVLTYLKAKYPLYHLSNVFFRDIQYGIQSFLERKRMAVRYPEAEKIAISFVNQLEREKILTRIDQQSWVLHYPEFKKPAAKPAAPAKPAASAPAVRPAASSLPPLKSGAPAAARPAGGLPPLKSAAPAGAKPVGGGLPPLKSPVPAGSAKPSGELPPLKSSAPVGGAKPAVPAVPKEEKRVPAAQPEPDTAATEVKTAPAKADSKQSEPTPKPVPTPGKLPPIKSSKPVGS